LLIALSQSLLLFPRANQERQLTLAESSESGGILRIIAIAPQVWSRFETEYFGDAQDCRYGTGAFPASARNRIET
jgi:hypothetical protein